MLKERRILTLFFLVEELGLLLGQQDPEAVGTTLAGVALLLGDDPHGEGDQSHVVEGHEHLLALDHVDPLGGGDIPRPLGVDLVVLGLRGRHLLDIDLDGLEVVPGEAGLVDGDVGLLEHVAGLEPTLVGGEGGKVVIATAFLSHTSTARQGRSVTHLAEERGGADHHHAGRAHHFWRKLGF
jgi:hypothetical protein